MQGKGQLGDFRIKNCFLKKLKMNVQMDIYLIKIY